MTTTTDIKAVVFDVGAVLIDWDPRHLYRKLMDDAAMETFLADICPYHWNLEMDRGGVWAEYVEAHTQKHPAHADLIRAYDQRWPEMVAGPIQGTVDIKNALRAAGVPLYAITNYSAEKWALSQTLWPFLADFDGVICSGQEGILKPDPRIYHLLYDRYGLNPAELLFIDDRRENIEAGEKTGMRGVVFTNPSDLAHTLGEYFDLKLAA